MEQARFYYNGPDGVNRDRDKQFTENPKWNESRMQSMTDSVLLRGELWDTFHKWMKDDRELTIIPTLRGAFGNELQNHDLSEALKRYEVWHFFLMKWIHGEVEDPYVWYWRSKTFVDGKSEVLTKVLINLKWEP